jgi:hypothetical protein
MATGDARLYALRRRGRAIASESLAPHGRLVTAWHRIEP